MVADSSISSLNKDMLDVIVDGKVQQKAVKVGATYGLYTIIESGIDVTDEVSVTGQNGHSADCPDVPLRGSKS